MYQPLTFCTSEELVHELINRKTFIGVVIMSKKENRNSDGASHSDFSTYTSLDCENLGNLLDIILQNLRTL